MREGDVLIKYQRFVAYVYEYRKGKKENNCGFLRVETRDGNVTVEVHMRCPGLPADEKCSVYGFVRNAGLMEGILLGNAWSGEEKLDCMIESDKMDDVSWKEEFQKFGGMIIQTENGAFFGTEWDDIPIKPENFDVKVLSEISPKVSADNSDKESKSIVEPEPVSNISVEGKESAESKPDAYTEIEMNVERNVETNVRTETEIKTDTENNKDFVRIQETENAQAKEKTENIQTKETEQSEHKSSITRLQNQYPENKQPTFCPFNDDEFTECRKIHPNEFFKSCPRMCALRNNRFLEHGYYNFGHLLVGKRANGQRILGVPGGYDQQERFMANMFGFPYFKESREVKLPGGRGGYWYRLLNPANFH